MLNKIFPESFLYGKPCRCDWMAKVVFLIQMLPTFSGRRNHIGLKILRLSNFYLLFQLVLKKFFKSTFFIMFTES